MANRAYIALWCSEFSEERMVEFFERLLETVPFSKKQPGFTSLVVRAVGPGETPLAEYDLRTQPCSAADLAELAREHARSDTALEAQAAWDVWTYDLDAGSWNEQAQPLTIQFAGPEYDDSGPAQHGHFQAEVGFEHLFTGHAGLLGPRSNSPEAPQHAEEARFLSAMAEPGKLQQYRMKTRDNVNRLLSWMRRLEETGVAERAVLWSEGEENLEARLDDILAER